METRHGMSSASFTTKYLLVLHPRRGPFLSCTDSFVVYAQAVVEVESLTPTDPYMIESIESMKVDGIDVLYGQWLIEGAPRVLLMDVKAAYDRLDEWKRDLSRIANIPFPADDTETNDAIVFGYLVAWFLGVVCHHYQYWSLTSDTLLSLVPY